MKKLIPLLFSVTLAASSINEHGYWCGEDVNGQHWFDAPLKDALVKFFQKEEAKTVVDFGCGLGAYVKGLRQAGFSVEGYDGNPSTEKLSEGVAKVQDLSKPFELPKKFDWVMSLEVGEHLPKDYETVFLENLHQHAKKGIILSWAIKGQGGYGHFNEQDNDYIKQRMMKYGYINDLPAEKFLREHSTLFWFKNTIMVFRKM